MSLEPIRVSQWSGLNLAADPGDAGLNRAISLQNVELDLNGTIRTRPGFDKVDATTISASPLGLYRMRADDSYLAISATDIQRWDDTLVSVELDAFAGNPTGAAVEWNSVMIVARAGDVLGTYSASLGIGSVLNTPQAKFLAVQPGDNRIVAAYAALGGSANPDRVHFSNAGSLAFGADDWVDLHPDNGEAIRAIVAWRETLFVFKESEFFVFYGNSTDSAGGAVFNYRSVNTGIGCGYDFAACAAQDGVYFVHTDGVYRTTGGNPELVSAALQPFFDERSNGFFGVSGPLSSPRIHAGDDRLYVWQHGATGMFVMDLRSREWTYWVLATAPYALLPLSTPREVLFVNSTGQLHKFSPDYTDDDGTAIASHYQSGYGELAEGAKVRVRRFLLEGSGTVNHATAADYGTAGTAASVTMGTAPAVALSYDTRSAQCRGLSFKVSATSGAWSLNRWTALLADRRGHR